MKRHKIKKTGFSKITIFKSLAISAICIFLVPINLLAQEEKKELSAEELAIKLANPVSSLISLPIQNNSDFGIGENKGSKNTTNVQPVIPMALSKKLNLILRWVQPIIYQANVSGPKESQSGLGDATVSAFFSPAIVKKGIIWGLGPVFLVPTGTNDLFSSKKLGTGLSAVILTQKNGFTVGGLVNQAWSVAGNSERPNFSQFYLQPFFAYNWKTGAGAGGNFEFTQNWSTKTSTLWFNPTVNGVISFGKQRAQLTIGPRFNLAAPAATKADWGIRCALSLTFPR